jgi:hypothetical protein
MIDHALVFCSAELFRCLVNGRMFMRTARIHCDRRDWISRGLVIMKVMVKDRRGVE